MTAQSILIVEDDQAIREMLADLLREEGYTILLAPDGKPALECLRTHAAGLVVLLDLMMPGMDGYAVLQALAADSPLAGKHAYILMTAAERTIPAEVQQLLQRLQVDLVRKPFDVDQVLLAIEAAAAKLP